MPNLATDRAARENWTHDATRMVKTDTSAHGTCPRCEGSTRH